MREFHRFFPLLALLAISCTSATTIHQRNNVAILEGHEVHRYSVQLTVPLTAGRHRLGTLPMGLLGDLPLTVEIDAAGDIAAIEIAWPKNVRPERLASVTHDAYEADGTGQLKKKKRKTRCELLHIGGSCVGCSSYDWVEVTY